MMGKRGFNEKGTFYGSVSRWENVAKGAVKLVRLDIDLQICTRQFLRHIFD